MTEDAPKLRITSGMSLERAMLEVRRYLAAGSTTIGKQVLGAAQSRSNPVRTAQFSAQAAMANRLSEIAARLEEVEPNSKLGAPGVFLKRVVRKAIGWYSRPAQEFDRSTVELLQQIRQDMIGLQQQVSGLQEQDASPQPQGVQSRGESGSDEGMLLMIELFKNISAVQSFRLALRDENPDLLRKFETILDKIEGESQELRAALTRSLETKQ
jgi:hypothetical protein